MDINESLNPMQQEAVRYVNGPLLILAGAGSGKTRVLTHRVAYLIEECNVNPWNIMAITFTNKAAGEMRERVDAIAGAGSEDVWVRTFHSTCVRILRRFADRIGYDRDFTIYDSDDQKTVIREVCKKLNIDTKIYKEKSFASAISNAKNNMISPERYAAETPGDRNRQRTAQVYEEYQKRLKENNALDFDDLLLLTVELFEKDPDVLDYYQERFRYIMVDEYQDTNTVQFRFVSLLASKYRNLCVVGDDDQSIYKFRGANILNILDFEETFPDAKVIRLEQNYRSTKTILEAANNVIRNNSGRKEKTLWTENEKGEPLAVCCYENEYDEASGIVSDIENRALRGGNDYSDFAVLYRTNAQSRVLEEKFVTSDVPYRVVGGVNFYQRREIKDILSYLRIINNGLDDVSVRRIVNVPKRGIGAATLEKADEYAGQRGTGLYEALRHADAIPGISKTAAARVRGFTDTIEVFRREAESVSISELFDSILEDTGYLRELEEENTDDAATRIENLDELRNKIITYEDSAQEPNLSELLEEIALVADVDSMDDSDNRVTLMTLHSAKGLEFPYVYMSGMEEGLFPGYMSLNDDDPQELEEERRLCYVGITRAKKTLALSWAKCRMVHGSREYNAVSEFVNEIPKELIRYKNASPGRYYSGTGGGERSYGYRKSYAFDDDNMSEAVYGSSDRDKGYGTKKDRTGKTFKPDLSAYIRKGSDIKKVTPDYGKGDRVSHVKFGIGTVTEIEEDDLDYKVSVDFDDYGMRKMKAGTAKLKKI